jgi:hypothetical protein
MKLDNLSPADLWALREFVEQEVQQVLRPSSSPQREQRYADLSRLSSMIRKRMGQIVDELIAEPGDTTARFLGQVAEVSATLNAPPPPPEPPADRVIREGKDPFPDSREIDSMH